MKVPVNNSQGHFSVKHGAVRAAGQHSSTQPIPDTNNSGGKRAKFFPSNSGGKRAKHNRIHSTKLKRRDAAYSHSLGNTKSGAKLRLLRALHRGVKELCNSLIPVRFGPATSFSLTAQHGKK